MTAFKTFTVAGCTNIPLHFLHGNEKSRMRLFRGNQNIEKQTLKKIFLSQLNNIFGIKTYLVISLPLMARSANFRDLKLAMLEGADEIKLQILRMEVIYKLLGEVFQQPKPGVQQLTRERYQNSTTKYLTPLEMDLSLLVLLRALESIENVCFKVLYDIAIALPEENLIQLLKENLDSAKDTKQLYELITKEYL